MNAAWVIVADASRARVFSAEKPASELVEIQTLTHPNARLHDGDLISDKPGKARSSGLRCHDMGDTDALKQEEALRFASRVCEALECGRTNGHFNKLHIIAAPNFLGLLRKQQTNPLQRLIASETAKNLTSHNIAEIRKNLPNYL